MARFGKTTGVMIAAAMAAITIIANVNPAVANAMEEVPVLGQIVKVVTFRTYEKEDQNHEARIEAPQVSVGQADNGEVNRLIEKYADELIKQYGQELKQDQGEGIIV